MATRSGFVATATRSRTGVADATFWAKSRLLIGRRLLLDALAADRPRPAPRLPAAGTAAVTLGEDVSLLRSTADPREHDLERGKIQNLRVAARALDGLTVERGGLFSFWRAVGRPTRAKGYVVGRELRQGCLIPTLAGGICQLSNALSRVATHAGMEIVERHRHSAKVEGLVFDDRTDATVFWNYVDFRFRTQRRVRLDCRLTETDLIVRLDALP